MWTWGPAMILFAGSAAAALPCIWRERLKLFDGLMLGVGFLVVLWIGLRAAFSPVAELAIADLLLLAMAVSGFLVVRSSAETRSAQRVIFCGLGFLLAASIWVIYQQILDPTYSPIFPNEEERLPAGFFAHYSYGASMLLVLGPLLTAVAIHSRGEKWMLRWFCGVIGVLGCAAVFYTKSRGGMLGIGAGVGILMLLTILRGRRDGAKWFPWVAIVAPILFVAGAVICYWLLLDVQELRQGDNTEVGVFDNPIRTSLISLAISCIGLHPFLGGGSRSFSWECHQFWDTKAMNWGSAQPSHVHNEFLQTAVDYGLIGAGLVFLLLISVILLGVLRSASNLGEKERLFDDGWRIGGVAGLCAIFVQSNFEGIFRIPPGAVMLGLAIGAASLPGPARIPRKSHAVGVRGMASLPSRTASFVAAICAIGLLGIGGVFASRVFPILWPVYFGNEESDPRQQIAAYSASIDIWPLGSFYKERGELLISEGKLWNEEDSPARTSQLEAALADYEAAFRGNPFQPYLALRLAALLEQLGRIGEAESYYRHAIRLQGEMEHAFRGKTMFARFLLRKGVRRFDVDDPLSALTDLQLAEKHMDDLMEIFGYAVDNELRAEIYIYIGRSFEEMGNHREALAKYDEIATAPYGTRAHYFAGILLGREAVQAWNDQRGDDALRLFIESKRRVSLAAGMQPRDEVKRLRYLDYLDKTIAFFQEAKVVPSNQIGSQPF